MIEVIIRMNVCGESKEYYPLGKMEIVNTADNPSHPIKGNYLVRFYSKNNRLFKTKRIMNHNRLSESIWGLLRKAIMK